MFKILKKNVQYVALSDKSYFPHRIIHCKMELTGSDPARVINLDTFEHGQNLQEERETDYFRRRYYEILVLNTKVSSDQI